MLTTLLALHPALLWFLFGIFCFVAEMILPGFFVFFFGLGAWCAALVALTPIPLGGQVLVFIATSAASLFWLRAKFKRMFGGGTHVERGAVNLPKDTLAEVVEAIRPPAGGKVKYGGSFWRAQCRTPVEEGATVRVLVKNGLVLTVEPLAEAAPAVDETTIKDEPST